MRFKARVDNNQKQIVDALKLVGASVFSLAPIGNGVCDLLVGYEGSNFLLEVKNGEKAKLTPDQVKFFQNWRGSAHVVRSEREALMVIGVIREIENEKGEVPEDKGKKKKSTDGAKRGG